MKSKAVKVPLKLSLSMRITFLYLVFILGNNFHGHPESDEEVGSDFLSDSSGRKADEELEMD